jgi:type VI secretion system protein ImpC
LPAVAASESSVTLQFSSLADFHPDHLYRTSDAFDGIRRSRARLLDPETFESEAAALVGGPLPSGPAPSAARSPDDGTPATGEQPGEMLERLLGSRPAASAAGGDDAMRTPRLPGQMLRDLVQPFIVRGHAQGPTPYLDALDAEAAATLRRLLHAPVFQQLESTWRGLRWLLDSVDGDTLQLGLLDVTKQELLDDSAASAGDFEQSALYRRLVPPQGPAADDPPWALLIGAFSFTTQTADLALLARLGAIGTLLGAPFLAAAEPGFVGCPALSPETDPRTWHIADAEAEQRLDVLRASVVAPWIGLAMPRFLLRLPYGPDTDPVEAFPFVELPGPGEHENYLWGNPAFACALVAVRWLMADRPDAALSGLFEIGDLPAHVVKAGDESRLQPCAEHLLGVQVGQALLGRGVIPLLSYRQRNAVRVGGLLSISRPAAPLATLQSKA